MADIQHQGEPARLDLGHPHALGQLAHVGAGEGQTAASAQVVAEEGGDVGGGGVGKALADPGEEVGGGVGVRLTGSREEPFLICSLYDRQ